MKKIYILDTSALIDDPSAYTHFKDSEVIIPIAVVNELDKKKTCPGEVGKSARVCCKLLDNLCNMGDISSGILIENNITIKVDAFYYDLKEATYKGFGDPHYPDTQILAVAYNTHINNSDSITVLVSNDINLRIKARARGIEAQSHDVSNKSLNDIYTGTQVIVNEDLGLDLQKNGMIDPNKYNLNLYPHECILVEDDNKNGLAMARKVGPDKLKLIKKMYPWGITCRNKEQSFAVELINDKTIDLVTLIGKAGTGKSIVTCAAALELVINKREYDKLVIYRPIQSVGNDIGFLPGPQPLDAKILTPNGWTTMGEVKPGSLVISRDGTPTKVLNTYPKGNKDVYKITTTDGRSTECCEDHLWYTFTAENRKRNKPGSIKSTKQIKETLLNKNNKLNHFLPRNEPVQFTKQNLPIPPYTFGAILGDGSISDSISVSNIDLELIEKIRSEVKNFGCELRNSGKDINYYISGNLYNNKPARPVKVSNIKTNSYKEYNSVGIAASDLNINRSTLGNRCEYGLIIDNFKYEYLHSDKRWQNPIKNALYDLGLSGKKAWDKFIPSIYKYSSVEDRISLLQGLMDTDGTVKSNGEASYCTTSKQLAEDVIELVQSLGGNAKLRSRNRVGENNKGIDGRAIQSRRTIYEFNICLPNNINPFFISRKANKYKSSFIHGIGIKSIELVGQKEVQCILIDNPEHLYITDNFIVTHNTMEEKLAPWFQAVLDSFEFLFTMKNGGAANSWKKELELYQKKGRIEMEAITYIRGRSIPNSIMWIDEVQNCSKEDIKTLLTRAGENTKIILTGDIDQIDKDGLDATNNGLTYVVEKFKNSELAGHVTFTQGERSKLATLASEIL